MNLNLKTILCTVCLSFMTTAAFAASNQHIKLEGIEGGKRGLRSTKRSHKYKNANTSTCSRHCDEPCKYDKRNWKCSKQSHFQEKDRKAEGTTVL